MEGDLEVIAGGCTGLIKLRADSPFVEKLPHNNPQLVDDSLQDYDENMPLTKDYLNIHNGCLHEFLRAPHGTSSPHDTSPGNSSSASSPSISSPPISLSQRLQFAADAAEGLSILHGLNIVHGDINSWNFLVNDDFRLCIKDFSGSTIGGEAGSGLEGCRYFLPRLWDDPSTVPTDLFALRSLLYGIATSTAPYEGFGEQEVEENFQKAIFPPTQGITLGSILLGCWQGAYQSAKAVQNDNEKNAVRSLCCGDQGAIRG